MKNLSLPFLFSLLLFIGCKENATNQAEQTPVALAQSPDILKESTSDYSLSRKRYSSDIIEKLFKEAMDKDKALKELNDRANAMYDYRKDSTKSINKYNQINAEYYAEVSNYTSRLKDSTLVAYAQSAFRELESLHDSNLKLHHLKLELINKKSIALSDQLILLKLAVTQAMMQNYQKNELPDIEQLKNLIEQYDGLIEEMKPLKQVLKLNYSL